MIKWNLFQGSKDFSVSTNQSMWYITSGNWIEFNHIEKPYNHLNRCRKTFDKIQHLFMILKNSLENGYRAVVPNLFSTRDHFCGRQFFWGPGQGLGDYSSTLHWLCTLFVLLLHQLHLRSSGIRFWRLGTPVQDLRVTSYPCDTSAPTPENLD